MRRRPLLTLGITHRRRPGIEQVKLKTWILGYLFLKTKIDTSPFNQRSMELCHPNGSTEGRVQVYYIGRKSGYGESAVVGSDVQMIRLSDDQMIR